MIAHSDLDRALARLSGALDLLDAAAAGRAEMARLGGDREEAMAAMADDRARLALELDASLARLSALDAACAEADGRLERAMGAVGGLIAPASSAPAPSNGA